jgi:hypothetical protein
MSDYRACIIGSDGHIYKRVDLDASDDRAAIAAAQQLVDGHDVELWQLGRKIAKFEPKASQWMNMGGAGS